jgi:hypothetical protein
VTRKSPQSNCAAHSSSARGSGAISACGQLLRARRRLRARGLGGRRRRLRRCSCFTRRAAQRLDLLDLARELRIVLEFERRFRADQRFGELALLAQ